MAESISNTYEVGDLVQFRSMIGGIVKGKVTAVYSDLEGPTVVFRVTSRFNNIYPRGIEVVMFADSLNLSKRERYNHG